MNIRQRTPQEEPDNLFIGSDFPPAAGIWEGSADQILGDWNSLAEVAADLTQSAVVIDKNGQLLLARGGQCHFGASGTPGYPLLAIMPAISPHHLGDRSFCRDLGITYPYIGGSMAHGISSPALADALGRHGMLGFIGAAGLTIEHIERIIVNHRNSGATYPLGFNLIHSPSETGLEDRVVDLYLKHDVCLVEASAFLNMSLPVVRYRVTGIHEQNGKIVTPNRIIAKISRVEVASKFFAPPPEPMLQELLHKGVINETQVNLARRIPMAQDITAEADSGGHTDNRPAISLLPTIIALRNRYQQEFSYTMPLRVGLGGGIATPASAAAAFAMGAAYVVVGSVHQGCIESGISSEARRMLAEAGQADTAMAPAGDMFEMGVNMQVLKRGTLFAMRAAKLYELYRAHPTLEALPSTDRANLEKNLFRDSLENIWNQCVQFFQQRDPAQLERATRDPKHRMALVFRWYLGKSAHWAVQGQTERKVDFQIWCGPAMGAFNEWVKGSCLERQEDRSVIPVTRNLLFGAALCLRLNAVRAQGLPVPAELLNPPPRPLSEIARFFP